MVALFLRAELASERFGPAVREALHADRADPAIVERPALDDADENAIRRRVLAASRGYGGDDALFSGFPADVRWERVLLDEDDLDAVLTIDYDYWVELSGGTRRVADGARNVREGAAPSAWRATASSRPPTRYWRVVASPSRSSSPPALVDPSWCSRVTCASRPTRSRAFRSARRSSAPRPR